MHDLLIGLAYIGLIVTPVIFASLPKGEQGEDGEDA